MNHYILKDKEPVEVDLMGWAKWFESADRKVAKDMIGKVEVSTVFLGLDHGYNGRIELFETMIFGGKHNDEMWRYATWDEAETGHSDAVNLVKEAVK